MKIKIGVIDYGMGNLHSVAKALALQGGNVTVSDSRNRLKDSNLLVLPGVGSFGAAMRTLARKKLDDFVRTWVDDERSYLGICLGYQLLFDKSDENSKVKGLGILPGRVVRFSPGLAKKKGLKIPHMGWNTAVRSAGRGARLFKGIKKTDAFYYVHTYYPVPTNPADIVTKTTYGNTFCSSVARGRLFASQFHPEKSGTVGLRLLKNIIQQAAV